MNRMQILFMIILLKTTACATEDNNVELDYCQMLLDDQSNLPDPELTDSVNGIRYAKRCNIFMENYSDLLEYSKNQKFPKVENDLGKTDSCKYWAITATLIHVAQARPEMFFQL